MRIPINRQDQTPLYKQVEIFIRDNILAGTLESETRLPATRQLAHDLGVNRITIATAYAELEADGLIYARHGSGTYIASPPYFTDEFFPLASSHGNKLQDKSSYDLPRWQNELAQRPPFVPGLYDLLRIINDPDVISFAGGISDPQLFPVDDFRKAMNNVLRRDGDKALGYGDRAGFYPLRQTIAHILSSQGIPARPENLMITSGSQQALALVSQLLVRPGDSILVESPTYSGALELFRSLNAKIIGVPVDSRGMEVDKVEEVLRNQRVSMIYTIPNFQNPTSNCMGGYRRRQLVALIDRYNVPLVEDDFVGDLRYDGRAQPALKAIDPGGRVIYINTFSKMIMPGLRVGYILAEGPVYEHLLDYKKINDLASSTVLQRALEAYISVGRYQTHLRRACQLFRRRRDAMLQAIEQYLPPETTCSIPQGGIFLWMQLPPGYLAAELVPFAEAEKVAIIPGDIFYPQPQATGYVRLNFSAHPPEVIETGIKRLGVALHRLQKKKQSPLLLSPMNNRIVAKQA